MIIETLSTFPDMYASVMGASMMRIAQEKGILEFYAHDLRDWTHDRHRTTDDEPYGGGDGLVMKCAPIFEAYEDICSRAFTTQPATDCGFAGDEFRPAMDSALFGDAHKASSASVNSPVGCSQPIYAPERARSCSPKARQELSSGAFVRAGLSERLGVAEQSAVHADNVSSETATHKPYTIFLAPQGRRFDDAAACELAKQDHLLFICGHYEGIDERAYTLADQVISLGDYVLTSGELASMVVIDAVVRKLPGVLGAETGALGESFADGLLEYPQYTRPANFNGMEVPPVLLSGNHGAVDVWRRQQSLERTWRLRPDLLEGVALTDADRAFLQSLSTADGR